MHIEFYSLSVLLLFLHKEVFPKQKLLKSYIKALISQERLSVALIAIEKSFLKELDVEFLIDDFALKHVNIMVLFG